MTTLLTLPQRRIFLARLARASSVEGAARAAGTSVGICRRTQREDKDFAALWEDAEARGVGLLEDTATQRAVHGWEEGVWHKGALVGYQRKYSDTLLMFRLKGERPAKYAHFEVGVSDPNLKKPVDKGSDVAALIEQRLAGLAARGAGTRLAEPSDPGFDPEPA